jgi:hypothetical protein
VISTARCGLTRSTSWRQLQRSVRGRAAVTDISVCRFLQVDAARRCRADRASALTVFLLSGRFALNTNPHTLQYFARHARQCHARCLGLVMIKWDLIAPVADRPLFKWTSAARYWMTCGDVLSPLLACASSPHSCAALVLWAPWASPSHCTALVQGR